MDWQQPASLAIVAVTGYFFLRSRIRSRRRARSRLCGTDCGCVSGNEPGVPRELPRAARPAERGVIPERSRERY